MARRKKQDWEKQIPWENHPWAQYATLDKNGVMKLWRDYPRCVESKGFWWMKYGPMHYLGQGSSTEESDKMMDEIEWRGKIHEYEGKWEDQITTRPKKKETKKDG